MNIEQAKDAYESLKRNEHIVESIDKEFFFRFADTALKELEDSQKATTGIYDDYQDLGKEYYKLQCELEEQTESNKELNKVLITYKAMINEMAKEIASHNYYEALGKLEDKEEVIDYYFKKVSDNK